MADDSRLQPFRDYTWDGVEPKSYKAPDGSWQGVTRHLLFGRTEAVGFHVRYFELEPGGYSSLEKHGHAHAVICIRGRAKALVGAECYPLALLDSLYIAPDTAHQFVNDSPEPFGFLCVVDAQRDRPRPADPADLAALLAHAQAGRLVRPGGQQP